MYSICFLRWLTLSSSSRTSPWSSSMVSIFLKFVSFNDDDESDSISTLSGEVPGLESRWVILWLLDSFTFVEGDELFFEGSE